MFKAVCISNSANRRDIDDAINKVNSLQDEINHVNWQLSDCDNASFWDIPKKAAIPGLAIELAALEVARAVAEGALQFAKGVIHGSEFVSCEAGLGVAQLAVDAAQEGSHVAIEAANVTLEATKEVTHALVETAEGALEVARRIGEEAVNVARVALAAGEAVALETMRVAQEVVNALESCAERLAYETARLGLEAAKALGSGALLLAKAGVAVGEEVIQLGLEIAHWVTEFFVSLIVITDVELSLELGKAVGGLDFHARVKGTIKDHPFEFEIDFNPAKVEQWIVSIFEKYVYSAILSAQSGLSNAGDCRLVDKVHKEILPSLD